MQIHHNGILVENKHLKITFEEGDYYDSHDTSMNPTTTTLGLQARTLTSPQPSGGDISNAGSQGKNEAKVTKKARYQKPGKETGMDETVYIYIYISG